MNKTLRILILILLVAGFLRFFNLGAADVIHDESINSFRSLGYLDFFAEAGGQTTTLDWFTDLPWWTKLSFHDHPPLSFLANYIFLNILGPTALATRIASALAGMLSVYLIYLVGQKLFNQKVGFLSALILAINNFFVWISRIGFQESLLISLALASLYFFILSLENKKFYSLTCLFLGLAFLTKYTAIFLVPVYVIILLFYKRSWLTDKTFYLSSLLFLIVISPLIIFNVLLFKARGHFDLQLSYLFGLTDKVEGWSNLVGKTDLTLIGRFTTLPIELTAYLSPIFLAVLVLGLLALVLRIKQGHNKILGLTLLSLFLLMGAVGPQDRFLTLFVPFFALTISFLFIEVMQKKKLFAQMILALFILFEAFYTTNTFFIQPALGQAPYTYSNYLKQTRGNWGFNQLDDYLNQELDDKIPAIRFQMSHPYLEKFVADKYDKQIGQELAAMIIYDFNIKDGPDIWYLRRRQFYQGWPVVTADEFIKETSEQGDDFYQQLGFDTFYFIQTTRDGLLRDVAKRSQAGKMLGDALLQVGIIPVEINNLQGELSFLVYKF